MSATEDLFEHDKGDPKDWTNLDAEEARKLTMLSKFHMTFEGHSEQDALIIAWKELQQECPRLKDFKWYK